jgi:hypothetical protein
MAPHASGDDHGSAVESPSNGFPNQRQNGYRAAACLASRGGGARRDPPIYDIKRYDLFLLRDADLPGVPGKTVSGRGGPSDGLTAWICRSGRKYLKTWWSTASPSSRPLADAGVGLHALFGFAAIAAVIMGGLSFTIARKSPATAVAPSPRQEEQQA